MDNRKEGDVVFPDLLNYLPVEVENGRQSYTCSLQDKHDGHHLAIDTRPLPAVSGVDPSLPLEDLMEPASDPDELVVVKR